MKKFLVVTAITNGKDDLVDPPEVFDNCDYVAYVDKMYFTDVWKQKSVLKFSTIDGHTHRRNAKPYKILSAVMFPEYEYVVWVDGNHQLKKNPQLILDEYGHDKDFLLFKHPDRFCVYEELMAVAGWQLDYKQLLEAQYAFYKAMNMPEKFGLFEMSTFIVKTTEPIKELQLMWWEQINRFSSRDQISLPYCLWKMNSKIKTGIMKGYANIFTMQGQMEGNEYFSDRGSHKKY